ncbi:MAG TPA: hypothetical protein VLT90_10480, partial [Terriglobales bacterium]|nr:hypothetical protein [Terriglobales bacterium]
MRGFWTWSLLVASVVVCAQQTQAPAKEADVILVAVSRNASVLNGGIFTGEMLAPGKLSVEPLAWLTPAGEWKSLECDENNQDGCRKFEKTYLSKPHT